MEVALVPPSLWLEMIDWVTQSEQIMVVLKNWAEMVVRLR